MWESDISIIISKNTEICNSSNILLFGIIRNNIEKTRLIFPIVEFILERIETVKELTIGNRVWDAELILRSVTEAFIKLMFITTGEGDERQKRLDEFWRGLAEINSIKTSEQAKKNLKYGIDSEINRLANLPSILPDHLEKELRDKWPNKKRKELEKKWSFTEIINSITTQFEGHPISMIQTLTHGYRMSSHILHGDETGILIINERDSRSVDERDKANRGHILRLLSDCMVFTLWTGAETMSFIGIESERHAFFKLAESMAEIKDILSKYEGQVFDDPDYDKYRD